MLRIRSHDFVAPQLEEAPVGLVNVFAPNNENHFLDLLPRGEEIACPFKCNLRSFLDRITASAATETLLF